MERANVTDYLIGADWKISDWLIKATFLKVKTAIRLGIKSRFGILGFSTSHDILGLCFFLFNNIYSSYA